jgi:sugar/nucleoside kinase (ribokinase family)
MHLPSEVLCAGIVVADHVSSPIDHVPAAGELVMAERLVLTIGGCAANAAVDLVKMGVRATVAGRVGDDVFGRVVVEMLREQGVDVAGLAMTPGADTSQTLIVNVLGEDRRFVHTFGANARFQAGDIPVAPLAECKVLYVGGYLLLPRLRQEELIPVFQAARRAGVRTVLDIALPGPGDHMMRVGPLLPHVDVFLPNIDEAQKLCGEQEPLRQAAHFRALGADTVVITMGGDGAVLVSGQERLRSSAYDVPYVDGTGAGDAFDAGFIYGLLHGLGAEQCLRVASALGASCVRALGTTPGVFTRGECEAFLRSHTLRIERL